MAESESISRDRILTEEEIQTEAGLMLEYEELIKREEIAWRQRSRALWLKEWDRNTKFFHKVANAHKRYNSIDQLLVQGELTQDSARIEGESRFLPKSVH